MQRRCEDDVLFLRSAVMFTLLSKQQTNAGNKDGDKRDGEKQPHEVERKAGELEENVEDEKKAEKPNVPPYAKKPDGEDFAKAKGGGAAAKATEEGAAKHVVADA